MKTTLLLAAIALTGCAGTNWSTEDLNRVKVGMPKEQVEQIMGSPYMQIHSGVTDKWIWSYAEAFGGAKACSIVFDHDTVSQTP
jgi:outer membrane protein assembly factor BamE (lipoprotein component of BamABCDE complex)